MLDENGVGEEVLLPESSAIVLKSMIYNFDNVEVDAGKMNHVLKLKTFIVLKST